MNFDAVLIITYGRSGSTLLQGLLNSIEGCLIRGENANFCYPLFLGYQSILRSNKNAGHERNDDRSENRPYTAQLYLDTLKNTVRKMLLADQYFNDRIRCYGFKEIRYTPREVTDNFEEYLSFLEKIFPRVAFVFNTRNLDDTVKSGWWREHHPGEIKDLLTQTESRFFAYMKTHAHHTFHIRYEDVITRSENLKKLFGFLGAEYVEKEVEQVLSIKHSFQPRSARRSALLSNDRHKKLAGLVTLIYPRMELDHFEEWVRHHHAMGIEHFWVYSSGDSVNDAVFGDRESKIWSKKPEANYHLDLTNEEIRFRFSEILAHLHNDISLKIFYSENAPKLSTVGFTQRAIAKKTLSLAKDNVEWLGFIDVDELLVGDLNHLNRVDKGVAAAYLRQKVFKSRWENNKPVKMRSISEHYGLVNFNPKLFARTNKVRSWQSVHKIPPSARDGEAIWLHPDQLRFHHFRGIAVPDVNPNQWNLPNYANLTLKNEKDNSHC